MKNPVLSTMLVLLIMSTAAFGQREIRKVKSRDGRSHKVTRVSTKKVSRTNRTYKTNNGYYGRNYNVNRTTRVRRVRNLPNYRRVNYAGVGYYYDDGLFYQRRNGYYNVVAAPLGYRVNVLPVGCRSFRRGGVVYYFNAGSYYRYNNYGYYQVVAPPQGLLVNDLPFGAEVITINGRVYYEYAGILYQRVETQYGYAYEVSGNLNS